MRERKQKKMSFFLYNLSEKSFSFSKSAIFYFHKNENMGIYNKKHFWLMGGGGYSFSRNYTNFEETMIVCRGALRISHTQVKECMYMYIAAGLKPIKRHRSVTPPNTKKKKKKRKNGMECWPGRWG